MGSQKIYFFCFSQLARRNECPQSQQIEIEAILLNVSSDQRFLPDVIV